MFFNIGSLKNFAKFTRKHLRQSFFFNKVAGLRPVNFAKSSRTPIFIEHLWWLLMYVEFIFFGFFESIYKSPYFSAF